MSGETNEKVTDRPYAGANAMGETVLIIKSLRHPQPGEAAAQHEQEGKNDGLQ